MGGLDTGVGVASLLEQTPRLSSVCLVVGVVVVVICGMVRVWVVTEVGLLGGMDGSIWNWVIKSQVSNTVQTLISVRWIRSGRRVGRHTAVSLFWLRHLPSSKRIHFQVFV